MTKQLKSTAIAAVALAFFILPAFVTVGDGKPDVTSVDAGIQGDGKPDVTYFHN